MLRSAASPNRTEVQPSSEMKQITPRRLPRRCPTPSRSPAHLPPLKPSAKPTTAIRLFED
jgi:hypothetical protein